MTTMIVTNGDTAAELLAATGRADVVLPWRDVLHDGPIVAGSLETASKRRAAFLAARFAIPVDEVEADFAARDSALRRHGSYDRVELWFEHDLYDQLQLVQLLDVFSTEPRRSNFFLVQADDFLGHQTDKTIVRFAERLRPLTDDDLGLGAAVWADLCRPSPVAVLERLQTPLEPLPFLGGALHRFLEELPGTNGLSRSEAATLTAIADGVAEPLKLFSALLNTEEAAFMGDASFFVMLGGLAHGEVPLVASLPEAEGALWEVETLRAARVSLTEAGSSVLGGDDDHIALNGIDRWWAGTHLRGTDVWRYDRSAMKLVPPRASAA